MTRASSTTPAIGLYSDALVYDVLHEPGTEDEIRTLLRIERRFTPALLRSDQRRWLEPACGSGRYLRAASTRGIAGLGVDLEPRMIAFAKAAQAELRGHPAPVRYVAGDMVHLDTLRLGRATFAFTLINSLRHLPTDRDLLGHLRSLAAVLDSRGVYVVGLSLCAYGLESETEDVWEGRRGRGPDRLHVKQVVQYLPPLPPDRDERVISHLTVTRGTGRTASVEERDSSYLLRGYDESQWRQIIARAGWTVRAVVDADAHDHTPTAPGYALWVLAPAVTARSRKS